MNPSILMILWLVSSVSGVDTGDRAVPLSLIAARSALDSRVSLPPSTTRPAAEPDNTYLWKPRTSRVAVFKNGFGFFMREGDVALRDGWCVARHIPPATFGTLAIYSHREGEIVDIVGSGPGEVVEFDGRDAPDTADARLARLGGCLNLNVQLEYAQADRKRTAVGRLASVGNAYAILETDENTLAVPVGAITRLQITDMPVRVHVIRAEGAVPERTHLGMAYLRSGITWIPEYTLKVIDDDTAELTLRATLVNEAEDLVHCDVSFVVGVPHFLHTQYLAPVVMGQAIRTIGAAVAPREVTSQIMHRAAISNSMAADQFAGGPEQPAPGAEAPVDPSRVLGNLPQMEAAAAGDYTVYTKKDLTVRRGEKAIVNLFVKRIKYSHLYRWSPPGQMQHFLLLANNTDTAWTTGPFLAVSEGQPLSEDLLRYTPRGGRCEVPMTSAMNVAGERKETEAGRKLKEHSPAPGVFLDLVRLEGELKIRTFEKLPVDVVIDMSVPGKPLQAPDGGTWTIDTGQLKLTERSGAFRWLIRLDPGTTKTLTYAYERYVPSN